MPKKSTNVRRRQVSTRQVSTRVARSAPQQETRGARGLREHPSGVAPILGGECIVCHATLQSHFKAGQWVGCERAQRSGDALFIPPMTVLLTPNMGGPLIPETIAASAHFLSAPSMSSDWSPKRATDAVAEAVRSTGRVAREVTEPVTRAVRGAATSAGARGRAAFLYFLGPKNAPKEMLPNTEKVFKQIASHSKRGIQFKDIVARASMAASTVDWALQRLMSANAIVRKPVTA